MDESGLACGKGSGCEGQQVWKGVDESGLACGSGSG